MRGLLNTPATSAPSGKAASADPEPRVAQTEAVADLGIPRDHVREQAPRYAKNTATASARLELAQPVSTVMPDQAW